MRASELAISKASSYKNNGKVMDSLFVILDFQGGCMILVISLLFNDVIYLHVLLNISSISKNF